MSHDHDHHHGPGGGNLRVAIFLDLVFTVAELIGGYLTNSMAIATDAQGMLAFAIVGVLVNGAAVLRLRGTSSLNARVVAWHLLEDVLGWVAVLIVSVVLLFRDVHILDPLLSVLITLCVLYVVGNLERTLVLFLQAVPEGVDVARLEADLLAIDRVRSVHHLHLWSLDGEPHVLSVHLVVAPDTAREQSVRIRARARALAQALTLEHAAVELEYEGHGCDDEAVEGHPEAIPAAGPVREGRRGRLAAAFRRAGVSGTSSSCISDSLGYCA